MSEPGWHRDPWNQAELRWWDGERWTEHVHGGAAAPAAAAAPAPSAQPSGRRVWPILLGVGLALLVVVVAVVVLVAAGSSSERSFNDPDFNIAFDHPPEYERREAPPGNADEKVALILEGQNGIVVFKFEQETANQGHSEFTKSLLDNVVNQLSNGPTPEGRRVTVGGLQGYEYELTDIKGLPGVTSRSIFLFHGRDQYQLSCESRAEKRAEVMRACDQAVETLEVTGPGR